MKNTSTEGYAYPLSTDLASPPVLRQFADAADADFPTWDAGFQAIPKSYAFRGRVTSAQAGITSFTIQTLPFATIEFNNSPSGYGLVTGGNGFLQPPGDGYAWWMFGLWLAIGDVTGPTAGKLSQAQITISDFDPVTNQGISAALTGDTRTTHSLFNFATQSGDYISICGLVRLLGQGSLSVWWSHNDTNTKAIQAGSFFWGARLGSA